MKSYDELKKMMVDLDKEMVLSLGGNKSACTRARGALMEVKNKIKSVREDLMAIKKGEAAE